MISVITGYNKHLHLKDIETIYRFRHWYFVDYLKWNALRKEDGREIDNFDTPSAIHLAHFSNGRLAAYSRLIKTTEPHLLSDIYPELMDGKSYEVGPSIYEWTRFAVDPAFANLTKLNEKTKYIFHGIAEYCIASGIKRLIVETHPIYISWLQEMNWNVTPISLPKKVDGKRVVVFQAEPSEKTLSTGRHMLNLSDSIVNYGYNLDSRQSA